LIWLLDTNIISELNKSAPDRVCLAWLDAHAADCAISTLSLAELRFGIERLTDGKRKKERDRDFRFLMEDCNGRFFDFDAVSALEWGRYVSELEAEYGSNWWRQFDLGDTQIAAIAREYVFTIATRNTRHFPFCKTENPFGS
jgi:toxin FitB